jgi:hyperpolarization activated cyclic nucleotide-gated potassium channel 2
LTWGLISPDGYRKLAWDFFCMLLIFYEIIMIPFELSFGVSTHEVWDIMINVIFLSDILVTFNTAYYSKGVLVQSRKQIAY